MKQNLVLITTLVVLYTCVTVSQSKPYYKWKQLDGDLKLFIDNESKYNWFEAMQECTLRNMTLITIDSPEKSDSITTFLKKNLEKPTSFWTSGQSRIGSKTFIWSSTGKQLEFTNWLATEPNNNVEQPNCITIGNNAEYEWLDYMCISKSGIICEENRFVLATRKDWEIKKEFIERLFSI